MKYSLIYLIVIAAVIQGQSKLIFSDDELVDRLKHIYAENTFINQIIEIADNYLDEEVKTITSVVSPMGQAHLHDYFSEGPYWWPNPENPNGPYIRKDGKRNPERFIAHKELMVGMYQAITSLSIAAYFTKDEKYSKKIHTIIDDWFINPKTKMAPNLKYAQMIRNKDVIRGVGIIETHRFVGLVEAILLLKDADLIREDILIGFDKWLSDYYSWLTKSRWGIDEKYRGNNHSSWWAAQSAAIAVYLERDEELFEFFEYSKAFLIDRQLDENCRQPLEEERTLSLSYSTFNLNALGFLSAALTMKGYNLFRYKNDVDCTIVDAAEFLNQYVGNPEEWELPQIKNYNIEPQDYIAIIGLKLNKQNFLNLYKELLSNTRTHSNNIYIDPFILLIDAQVSIIN